MDELDSLVHQVQGQVQRLVGLGSALGLVLRFRVCFRDKNVSFCVL